jgi:2',3'-cyclic-nucleotide 2'-phosphodiesterase (5'-nucleotidase family)
LVSANPILAIANEPSEISSIVENQGEFTLSILQTTDVHCQVHPHDELFWENDQAVFRKTGGYAHLATYLRKEKKKNPNTLIIDTGDMFQGSELSVKTSGKAMVPVLNALGYDLYLPGNHDTYWHKLLEHLMHLIKSA